MNFHLAFHLLSAKNNNTDGRITSTPISIVEQQIFLTLMAQLVQLVLPLPNRTDFGRTSKNSRTLPAEIAWKTWCCVVYTVNPNFQDRGECHF